MNTNKLTKTFMILATLLPVSVLAQDMDHSAMSHDNPQKQQGMSHNDASHVQPENNGGHMMKDEQMGHDEPHKNMQHENTSMESNQGEHHGEHSSMTMKRLKALPPSGKSREANYDGTYMMHSTAIDQSLDARCALASRGLMMLDNASWEKCGGKPEGWSKGIGNKGRSSMDHGNHNKHE